MGFACLSTDKPSQTNQAQSYTVQISGVCKYLLNVVNITQTLVHIAYISNTKWYVVWSEKIIIFLNQMTSVPC